MLKANNLQFNYCDKPVLKGVSIEVKRGGITALIGPSGSGKTTLLKCLSMLEKPQNGSVEIEGRLQGQNPWPKVTVVFQQLFLWPHLTLRENILLPIRENKNTEAELNELIEAFEMQDFIDRYPNEASGGQRQRVALARALMLKPDYLLLDEITSALDVEQIERIVTYLKNLRGGNMGIFIITHLLGFARNAADSVIFMADGEIVESGSAEILTRPSTKRLAQFLSLIEAAS